MTGWSELDRTMASPNYIQRGVTVILVSSASHMTRAARLFEAAGVTRAGRLPFRLGPRREERNIRAQLPRTAYSTLCRNGLVAIFGYKVTCGRNCAAMSSVDTRRLSIYLNSPA